MLNLNFTATNLKLKRERQIFKLRNVERSLTEELYSLKAEIEHLTEQLEVRMILLPASIIKNILNFNFSTDFQKGGL